MIRRPPRSTLFSLHDALPIFPEQAKVNRHLIPWAKEFGLKIVATNDVHYVEKSHSHAHDCLVCIGTQSRSEEHTSELQSRLHLVCRLLLEKKKKMIAKTGHVH